MTLFDTVAGQAMRWYTGGRTLVSALSLSSRCDTFSAMGDKSHVI